MMKQQVLLLLVILQCLLIPALAKPDAKTQKLANIAKDNHGLIKLNSRSYEQYTEGKRSYGLVVLLTALDDHFRCVPCREFDPEYKLVASSFQRTKNADRVFFGHLDFKDGQAIYQKLAIQTAPNVFYFPPVEAGQKKDPIRYDNVKGGLSAESLAAFLSREMGMPVPVSRPIDYTQWGIKLFLVLGAAAVIKLAYPYLGFLLFHKNTWMAISIVWILTMISGHMWNRIRTPPYVMYAQNKVNYIAGGFSQQLGLEVEIVAAICMQQTMFHFKLITFYSIDGVLAFAIVSLAVSVPKFDDKLRQRIGVYVWTLCVIVIFSVLMNLFRLKNGAYPFHILF
ncbi:oligosaccharyl transferase subunit ost3/OST6 [Apophysomyces sp. BC1034]|nr:oligosaccharyl transferase subunit ost3/OST6 [Apophysomyces sp. BC1015]KAG0181382.1 oligosaccharyl transferase subunit ost3/OST6 [Apophysomyces sp. BC1021]KAG0191192.1 oligosaccharyl transferase subunit ost3/OST6 [Apophysomyces sp. BC1034]